MTDRLRPAPARLALDVRVNRKRVALANSHGMSVVTAILSWVESHRVTHADGLTHRRPAALDLRIGGLVQDRGVGSEHATWFNGSLALDDVVTVRVVRTTRTQPPKSVSITTPDTIQAHEKRQLQYLSRKYRTPRRRGPAA